MSRAAMKTNVLGTGQLGQAAAYYRQACRLLQTDQTVPGTVVCPPAGFLAPDAMAPLLTAGAGGHNEESLLEWLAPFGAQPLQLQPSPLGDDAGIAESLPLAGYVANQGAPNERAQGFVTGVRALVKTSEPAPAFIVTALSGVRQGQDFFPLISGTACASNPYVWSEYIDPQAGVACLALGLDLPLRDDTGDNFVRVAALGAPQRRPEADFDDIAQHSQRFYFLLNEKTGQVESAEAADLLEKFPALPVDLLTSSGPSVLAPLHGGARALTFERLLTRTDFVGDLQRLLRILSAGFNAPAEIAFTCNVDPAGAYQIHLHHAQPMADWPLLGDLREQITVGGILNPARTAAGRPPPTVARVTTIPENILFAAEGAVLGRSRRQTLEQLIYVMPEKYAQLPRSARFEVARLLGRLNRSLPAGRWALLGPGRWCTTSPELGLPTTFAEINRATALVELVEMHTGLTPDVSRGIHIFNELVATGMLYLAIFPGHPHNALARERLASAANRLPELAPDAARWAEVVRVLPACALGGAMIELHADSRRQRAIAYAAGDRPGG